MFNFVVFIRIVIFNFYINDPLSFYLTTKIYSALEEPKYIRPPRSENGIGEVRGVLNLTYAKTITKAKAECIFRIPPNWLLRPPAVICKEEWVKQGEQWHVQDSVLCYVLDHEWRDFLNKLKSKNFQDELENIAAFWCIRNTKALLYKHRQANDLNLTEWPQKWDFWDHGDKGREEYAQSKRR